MQAWVADKPASHRDNRVAETRAAKLCTTKGGSRVSDRETGAVNTFHWLSWFVYARDISRDRPEPALGSGNERQHENEGMPAPGDLAVMPLAGIEFHGSPDRASCRGSSRPRGSTPLVWETRGRIIARAPSPSNGLCGAQ